MRSVILVLAGLLLLFGVGCQETNPIRRAEIVAAYQKLRPLAADAEAKKKLVEEELAKLSEPPAEEESGVVSADRLKLFQELVRDYNVAAGNYNETTMNSRNYGISVIVNYKDKGGGEFIACPPGTSVLPKTFPRCNSYGEFFEVGIYENGGYWINNCK